MKIVPKDCLHRSVAPANKISQLLIWKNISCNFHLTSAEAEKKTLFLYNSWMFSFIKFLLLPLSRSDCSFFLNYSNCMKRKTCNVLRVPHAPDTLFCCTVCFFQRKYKQIFLKNSDYYYRLDTLYWKQCIC